MISRHLPVFFLLVPLTAGCSSGPDLPDAYPVNGSVTGGTGSLEGVIIAFNPVDDGGVSASGTVGADGKYSLQTADGRPGAPPGRYKVTLARGTETGQEAMKEMMAKMQQQGGGRRPSGPPKLESPFPDKYLSPKTSDKEVEVKAESNVIDIAL